MSLFGEIPVLNWNSGIKFEHFFDETSSEARFRIPARVIRARFRFLLCIFKFIKRSGERKIVSLFPLLAFMPFCRCQTACILFHVVYYVFEAIYFMPNTIYFMSYTI